MTNELTKVGVSDTRRKSTFALNVIAHRIAQLNKLLLIVFNDGISRHRKKSGVIHFVPQASSGASEQVTCISQPDNRSQGLLNCSQSVSMAFTALVGCDHSMSKWPTSAR